MGERIKQKTTEDDSRLVLGICNYSCTELYMLANWTPILIDFVSVCVRMEGYKVAYPSRYAYLMPMTPELLSCIKLDESVPGKADYRKGDASYTGLLINKNVVEYSACVCCWLSGMIQMQLKFSTQTCSGWLHWNFWMIHWLTSISSMIAYLLQVYCKNLLCKAKSTSFLLQMKGLTISNLEYTQL